MMKKNANTIKKERLKKEEVLKYLKPKQVRNL